MGIEFLTQLAQDYTEDEIRRNVKRTIDAINPPMKTQRGWLHNTQIHDPFKDYLNHTASHILTKFFVTGVTMLTSGNAANVLQGSHSSQFNHEQVLDNEFEMVPLMSSTEDPDTVEKLLKLSTQDIEYYQNHKQDLLERLHNFHGTELKKLLVSATTNGSPLYQALNYQSTWMGTMLSYSYGKEAGTIEKLRAELELLNSQQPYQALAEKIVDNVRRFSLS